MTLDSELVELAAQVVAQNQQSGRQVTTAESCTGGLVAAAITEIAGASNILQRAFVTYSNDAKSQMLGVPEAILQAHGAVSTQTAEAMARGALNSSSADVAVAISGIAGPDGGSAEKPVGTVAFARATAAGTSVQLVSEMRYFDPNLSRSEIRRLAAGVALRLLLP